MKNIKLLLLSIIIVMGACSKEDETYFVDHDIVGLWANQYGGYLGFTEDYRILNYSKMDYVKETVIYEAYATLGTYRDGSRIHCDFNGVRSWIEFNSADTITIYSEERPQKLSRLKNYKWHDDWIERR